MCTHNDVSSELTDSVLKLACVTLGLVFVAFLPALQKVSIVKLALSNVEGVQVSLLWRT